MTVAPSRDTGRLLRGRMAAPSWPAGLPRVQRVADPAPKDWRTVVASYALMLTSIVVIAFLFNLTVVSQLQHWNSQRRLYDELRLTLAEGATPIGQLDNTGKLVAHGTPIALLQIPSLGVKEVVVEGTSSRDTKLGVGHRADSPMPGQPGTAILFGRASAYGGPFGQISHLHAGDQLTLTTGQGVATYEVIGPRLGDTQLPQLGPTDGRLTLVTARGRAYQPSGVLRVDARLTSKAQPRPTVAVAPNVVDEGNNVMEGDTSRVSTMAWLAELLAVLAIAAVWSWKRWNHAATWLVFSPFVVVVALAVADHATDLLPNLL